MKLLIFAAAFGALSASHAEGGAADAVQVPAAQQVAEPAGGQAVIPALTPVEIEIMVPLGSKLSKSGDMFPIRLVAPIVLNGAEAVPAGTTGMGEVIHAKKGGGMGATGELIVTALYLEVGERRLPLRSMHFSGVGKDRDKLINALTVGAAASALPISLANFAISGGQVEVAAGTRAQAKTAADFELSPARESGSRDEPDISDATEGEPE